jgi:hypothetical protein
MANKVFDCVEMKRRGAERVLAETAGMTPGQELEYWRAETEKLAAEARESTKRVERKPSVHPAS